MNGTIKVAAIVLAVILLGGVLWYFIVLRPLTTSITETPSSTNTETNPPAHSTTVSVSTNNPSTQTGQVLNVDVDKAYKELFGQFGATPVPFIVVSSATDKEYGSIYALYSADVSQSKKFFPEAGNYSIGVSLADLNGDGVREALVYENLPGYCGTGGCLFNVYQKQSGSWKQILSTLAGETVGVSDSSTNNFNNILVTTKASAAQVEMYVWDGSKYKSWQTVATWNGSKFVAGQ